MRDIKMTNTCSVGFPLSLVCTPVSACFEVACNIDCLDCPAPPLWTPLRRKGAGVREHPLLSCSLLLCGARVDKGLLCKGCVGAAVHRSKRCACMLIHI